MLCFLKMINHDYLENKYKAWPVRFTFLYSLSVPPLWNRTFQTSLICSGIKIASFYVLNVKDYCEMMIQHSKGCSVCVSLCTLTNSFTRLFSKFMSKIVSERTLFMISCDGDTQRKSQNDWWTKTSGLNKKIIKLFKMNCRITTHSQLDLELQ